MRSGGHRLAAAFAASALALVARPAPLPAQGWQAILTVDPFPSPYMSDWEIDPTIGQLTVTNLTSTTTDVTMHYTVTRGGQLLLTGVTDPQTIPAGQSVVFDATSGIGGEADWNTDFERLVTETGRLPEGEYEGCVRIVDPSGFAVVERQCVRFTTLYPDPPFLVFPMNGDSVTTTDPIFEWLPVQVPPLEGVRVGYVLEIAEVNTEAQQLPEVALESNIRQYVEPDLIATNHQYPLGALPFSPGRTYAWRVQALDGNGRPISANQGRSEVWTFVFSEPEGEVERPVASIALTPQRDTLRFSGDTARYEATAFDADNVEIPGKRFAWRAADTTVATVDSIGVATGVGAGATQILASVDGVTDSALSVTAVPTGLMASFETYDPEAQAAPTALLALIQSGTFEEVVPQLIARLQAGEFRIPIPRLPGLPGDQASLDTPGGDAAWRGEGEAGGPYVPLSGDVVPGRPSDACPDQSFDVDAPYVDLDLKVFALYLPLNREQRDGVTHCLGVPNDTTGAVEDVDRHRSALFVASWKHPGLPRAFLAVKGPGLGLTLFGPKVHVRYLVINPTPTLTVGADLLPPSLKGFFGNVTFDAGPGATFYSIRRCEDDQYPFCKVLKWINPDSPDITIQAFAGVNASEVSYGTGGAGASVALGFSISAELPVRRWNQTILAGSLDSTQIGLSFAAQDSLVKGAGAEEGTHHRSISVAPTLKVWFTGSGGNSWEVDGSVGFEVDPDKPGDAVKLVVAAEVPARWKLLVARLGDPIVVFTKKLEAEGAVELGLSGSWGVGPWDGNPADAVGLDEGDAGFEELGRGGVLLKWEKPGAAPLSRSQSRVEERKARWFQDSVSTAVPAQALGSVCSVLTIQLASAAGIDTASVKSFPFESLFDTRPDLRGVRDHWTAACAQADASRRIHEERLDQIAAERQALATLDEHAPATPQPSGPPKCEGTLVFNNTRCFSWSARLSVTTSSLVDVLALAIRFLTGTQ